MPSISWNEIANSLPAPLSIPTGMSDVSVKTAALGYANAGWFVIPVKNGTKHPGSVLGSNWPNKSTRDPDEIERLFKSPDIGVALHVGKSGAICFDVDKPDMAPLRLKTWMNDSSTPFQSTRTNDPGRGHFVFAATPAKTFSNSNGRLGKEWGEVRGQNGIIVVCPTVHVKAESGGRYKWVRTGVLPFLPADLADRLPTNQNTAQPALELSEVNDFLQIYSEAMNIDVLGERISSSFNRVSIGSRHNFTRDLLMVCLRESMAGIYPAELAVVRISHFFTTIKPVCEWTSPSEYVSIVKWCVAQAQNTSPDEIATIRFGYQAVASEGIQKWIAGLK